MEPELTPREGGGLGLTADGSCGKHLGTSVCRPQSLLPGNTHGFRGPWGLFSGLGTGQNDAPRGGRPPAAAGRQCSLERSL